MAKQRIEYDMPTGTHKKAVRGRRRSRRRRVLQLPRYTVGEEILNGISHGVGALLAIAGTVLLLLRCSTATEYASCSVYGASLILLYVVSCLYHSLDVCRGKKVFQVLDHCTINLLIAGTYTPLVLLCFPPQRRWVCLLVWAIAAFAIVLNAVDMHRFRVVSMVCYIGLGWMIAIFWKDIYYSMDSFALTTLIAGGIVYTVGAILFGVGVRMKYMHSVFHFFVVAASVLHYLTIYHMVAA